VKGQHITVAAAFFPHFFATAQKRAGSRVSGRRRVTRRLRRRPGGGWIPAGL